MSNSASHIGKTTTKHILGLHIGTTTTTPIIRFQVHTVIMLRRTRHVIMHPTIQIGCTNLSQIIIRTTTSMGILITTGMGTIHITVGDMADMADMADMVIHITAGAITTTDSASKEGILAHDKSGLNNTAPVSIETLQRVFQTVHTALLSAGRNRGHVLPQ
ncbi:hypothetical protein Q5Y75_27595 [Ruegeria sp. 2205SS24-7]|uniref:hypothetical protein n=1 Tax=Ruegeria discodermiae TaxID=3064389 RepID=UPI0027419A43|nr:hypothetical protein [Ruegeria sp. 2205SS24-7]MDP5220953.1 hypothetical protein [Ruegeria sp. 2205SS24-7]